MRTASTRPFTHTTARSCSFRSTTSASPPSAPDLAMTSSSAWSSHTFRTDTTSTRTLRRGSTIQCRPGRSTSSNSWSTKTRPRSCSRIFMLRTPRTHKRHHLSEKAPEGAAGPPHLGRGVRFRPDRPPVPTRRGCAAFTSAGAPPSGRAERLRIRPVSAHYKTPSRARRSPGSSRTPETRPVRHGRRPPETHGFTAVWSRIRTCDLRFVGPVLYPLSYSKYGMFSSIPASDTSLHDNPLRGTRSADFRRARRRLRGHQPFRTASPSP